MVISTFGLLSPSKGIEHVVGAIPALRCRVGDVVYLVAGRTHPEVVRLMGERYRHSLESLTFSLGVDDIVRFRDWFHDVEELLDLLSVCDRSRRAGLRADGAVRRRRRLSRCVGSCTHRRRVATLDGARAEAVRRRGRGRSAAELIGAPRRRHAPRVAARSDSYRSSVDFSPRDRYRGSCVRPTQFCVGVSALLWSLVAHSETGVPS